VAGLNRWGIVPSPETIGGGPPDTNKQGLCFSSCGASHRVRHASLAAERSYWAGSWMEWQTENLPDIKRETVRKYMQVARVARGSLPAPESDAGQNTTSGGNLKNAASLRQAFVAIGLLPAPENKAEDNNPNKPWVKFIRFLDGFRLWFNRRVDDESQRRHTRQRRANGRQTQTFLKLYQTSQKLAIFSPKLISGSLRGVIITGVFRPSLSLRENLFFLALHFFLPLPGGLKTVGSSSHGRCTPDEGGGGPRKASVKVTG